MIYKFYFSDGAGPKTGLSPTLDIFVKVSDGTSAGTPPTPSELSGGFYKFTYAPTEDVAIRIDSNDVNMAGVDRYIAFVASLDDDRIGDVPTAAELIAAHGSGAWTPADVSALATTANVAAVPSDMWDEILTGATHNIPTSAGKRIREIGAFAIHSGTAQAGNSHSITLAATADANDGVYNRNLIVLTDNTGVGQTRTIVDYDATSKVVVVDRDWRVSPDATTAYQIVPDDTPLTVDHGIARGGTSRTITIRDYAASDDDAYLCNIIAIIAGTGRGQARLVDLYDGTTKVVTICGDDWVVPPDTTSVYVMMPYGTTCTSCVGDHALAQINTEVVDAIEDLTDEIGGKWEIIGNQMIFYKADNVTEVMRFNLFDAAGDPAMENVHKRERVP